MFLLTFSQVNSFSGEINTQNSYLISNKIEVIKKVDLVITGYYSPLPNQKKYVTGSYEKEIALNGDGVGMASGKKVFIGAIAAPKKYDFGTKIYIEGYGVGVVEDRGGKVIDDNHTKIDIWMGYGDEGLQRAINWGSKKTTGYIVSSDTDTNFSFGEPIITDINYNTTEKLTLTPESNKNEVKKVQEYFKGILFYYGEIDGKYESIKPTVIKYQLQKGIIKSENDTDAGYIGPKTNFELNKDLNDKNSLQKIEKDNLLQQIIQIKKKLGDKYEVKAQRLLEKIKILKNRKTLKIKTKLQLEYLEMIL
ncbi:MAG: 3D domain-containing protein [Candidatus Gracilibacteria bacterium]